MKKHTTKEEMLAELAAYRKENQRLQALSTLNQIRTDALFHLMQMEKSSEKELLDFALEAANRITESPVGYLAFVSDNEQVLTMYSWSWGGLDDCRITQKPLVYYLDRIGLWGECIRQRRPIVTNDYSLPNPMKKGLPAGHVPLQRHLNVPVFDGEKIVLVAGVGNKVEPYNDSDLQQLLLLMNGVWRIIQKKRNDAERARNLLNEEHFEMLRETAKIKDEFVSVVSHELRTPLNAISGFGSLLADNVLGPLNERQKNAVDKILTQSDRMLSLINDILDYTKLRSKKYDFFLEKVNYADVVREAVDSLSSLLRDKKLTIETTVSVDQEVYVDSRRATQVLCNLLSNALKFSPPQSKIKVRAFFEQSMIVTEVEDEGIGLSPEDIPKLFSPFRQLDMSTTRSVGGTGLGLSICKEIVEALGGTISASSPGLGKGATFRFLLPSHTPPRQAA